MEDKKQESGTRYRERIGRDTRYRKKKGEERGARKKVKKRGKKELTG